MSEATCPACGAAHDVGTAFTDEQCPACGAGLDALFAAAGGGE
jgi:predicted nucleic acid-binding Zn ribbon protein